MKARAVVSSIPGVNEFWMCGGRSVFTLKEGQQLDEKALAAAFEKQGMKLTAVDTETRDKPAVVISYPTEGLG